MTLQEAANIVERHNISRIYGMGEEASQEDLGMALEVLLEAYYREVVEKDKEAPICEYSGLRSVEGYKEEEVSPQDTPAIDTKKEDVDYMYKWIREKSGK